MQDNSYVIHAIFLVVYLLALMGVGAMKARKIKTQEDFSLAGRGLSTFVLVGTLLATWIGTGSIFGNAEETYNVGVAAFIIPSASLLGIVALYFLAARIKRFGQFTIQDILEARFGVVARMLGTLTLLTAYVIIVSYQYRAGQAVVSRIFPGLDPTWCIAGVALFVIAYTALAGMVSVAYTDVANGILMTIGILCAVPFLLDATGGLSNAIESLPTGAQSLFGHYSLTAVLSITLPAFFLIIGDANMYQRFFSARDTGSARRSAAWMFIGVLVVECAIILTALLGSALVAQGKLPAPENPGHIVVAIAFDVLPALLGAMLVGTIVAIIVSTADSFLLAPTTSLVRDVYQRFLRPDASQRDIVRVSRIVVLVLGLLAFGLAFSSDEFFNVALFAYTIYGVGITPVMLAAFFWKRANSAGAVASMLTGVAVAIGWKNDTFGLATSINAALETSLEPILVALPLSLVALVVVSLMTPAPTQAQSEAI